MYVSELSISKKQLDALEKAQSYIATGIKNALHEIGLDAARSLSDSINNQSRNGRTYFINGTPYEASAPGEFPANRTSKLKKSMNYITRGNSEVEWGSESPYAGFLEDGTSKMAPRALVQETYRLKKAHHAVILESEVDNAIKRHS